VTLIRELIEIPEYVQRGDFVLRLTEGVDRAEQTLRDYVVTPELKGCFDNALAFIRSASESNTSKATYLHGSFGSGKSHFMAVLHLILQGNTTARGIPELAPVISKHNEWIADKRFLLVPYHMIGSHDMESGILGGYVDYIRTHHPEAPIPGVYLAEGMFRDAEKLRETMGDEAFFARLNEDTGGEGGWGDLEADWDADRFAIAIAAPPGSEDRSQLISALVRTYFSSYDMQATRGEAYISLDKGLSVLSKHAKSLGYDGLILFLDELILWLASHAADLKFVHQEGQKLAKLVEAQTPDRPVPIVSFVARQRDLSELIGDSVPGADRLNFSDALRHWEGRFHTITLEDRNLPAIAEKRVLRCKSDAARKELDAAFAQTAKVREAVMNVLLTSEGDRAVFRKIYPFSPALVQTLIAVSSVLQRERTALKVMMQLLVDQRDTLKVGDIVPVGDLFDVIAHGDEAFSQEMAIHFDNAKRLYHQKLLPALEAQHGRREDLDRLPYDDPKRTAFRNDDRLVKTLLLAALVPEVETLRSLNAERLAALNHGTIKTPIPGREGQEVLRRCKNWAASVGEIRIGEEANPTISVQLSGVDTEGIIAQARSIDNQGNRVRRIRDMLFEQIGVNDCNELLLTHEFLWRNTKRSCEIFFRNIRDQSQLPDSSLANEGDDWKLVIDYPFDEPNHGPRDDIGRIQQFRQNHPEGAKTLCWIPTFFSDDAKKDLGMLVILDHILSGERFAQYSSHLSVQDRQAARSPLENQRSVLRQRVQNHLEAAYGLDAPGSLDPMHELELSERFVSLMPGFEPQPPAAANLNDAMLKLLGQALAHEFPAAPEFEAEVKMGNLKKVYEVVGAAARAKDGRIAVDRLLRPLLRQIADPLPLGEMGHDATHFVLGQHWKTHFTRKAAEAGSGMNVSQLRIWIDDPKAMGLPRDVQDLVILVFAEQTNRSFYLHGAPYEATLGNLPDACELREQKLPNPTEWAAAVERAGGILGVTVSPLLNISNVSQLISSVKSKADAAARGCRQYASDLRRRLESFGVAPDGADRLQTAAATAGLLEKLQAASDDKVISLLTRAELVTSQEAMGGCVGQAAALSGHLDATNWEIFEAIAKLDDDRRPAAEEIHQAVCEALASDEHVVSLATALSGAQSKAVRLLTKSVTPQPQPPVKPEPPKPKPGKVVIDQGSKTDISLDEAAKEIQRLQELAKKASRTRVTLSWLIEGDKSK
jgi:hypothetical protein